VNKILIDISAKEIWKKKEISLVRKVLLFCYDSLSLKESLELSVRLTDDKEIMGLNKTYRNKNSPTNVLSFCSQKNKYDKLGFQTLGDLVISRDTVIKELAGTKKTFEQHISHLTVHGFLHLLGYIHEDDNEAKRMEDLETKILIKLNIPDPYFGIN
jgi:probable rRNA maturation factor